MVSEDILKCACLLLCLAFYAEMHILYTNVNNWSSLTPDNFVKLILMFFKVKKGIQNLDLLVRFTVFFQTLC